MDTRDVVIIALSCYAVLSAPLVVLGTVLLVELVGVIRENLEEFAIIRKNENSGSK